MDEKPNVEQVDIETSFEEGFDVVNLSQKQKEMLVDQINAEYTYAYDNFQGKAQVLVNRLKLYNNQKKDDDAIGDPLIFTIQNSVMAELYTDRLDATFEAEDEGDVEQVDNVTDLAKFDYRRMKKDVMDYNWIWDTCFFGNGYVGMYNFNRETLTPVPDLFDPTTFLKDPDCVAINGNEFGFGSARFFGRVITQTRKHLAENPAYFEWEGLDVASLNKASNQQSLLQQARQGRADALGVQYENMKVNQNDFGVNAEYELLEWYTHFDFGDVIGTQKVLATLGNERSKIIRIRILPSDYWRVSERALFPVSHQNYGVSIPDLIEDKQRARAVTQNLTLRALKSELYPTYGYSNKRINNRADLDFGFNKFIPIEGEGDIRGAIQPINKVTLDKNLIDYVLDTLDSASQRATASPELKQGAVSEQQRTLGELNLVTVGANQRRSLSASVFGWSEKDFWRMWYHLYKRHFKDGIDEKVIRINGAFGSKWRPLRRDNIVSQFDPDIFVESRVLAEAKKAQQRTEFLSYLNLALQEETANKRYAIKKAGRLFNLETDEINRLLPPTPDELQAEDENDLLNDNETVTPSPNDNHLVHMEMHSKANQTPAWFAHMEAHKKLIQMRKDRPELFDPLLSAREQLGLPQEQGFQQVEGVSIPRRNVAPSQTNEGR